MFVRHLISGATKAQLESMILVEVYDLYVAGFSPAQVKNLYFGEQL